MNRSESKYFATAVKMDEALLKLLEKKDLAYITVKEICETAGVNRSTFYLHYETIGELLTESIEHMNRQFIAYMDHDSGEFVGNINDCRSEELYLLTPEYLMPYLCYIRDHKRLFKTAMENAGVIGADETYGRMFRHVFSPILTRFGIPEADRRYMMRFYINGLMAIIAEWLKDDCRDMAEHVIAVMERCVMKN